MMRLIFLLFVCSVSIEAAEPVSYRRDVRPILAENCFNCHGQDAKNRKADLRLDTKEGQATALKVGKPDESELVRRILSKDKDEIMPPPKSNRMLSSEQKEILRRWVAEGATFEGHWAYQKPSRPDVPNVPGATNPIDAFLRAKMPAVNQSPSPEADKTTLIRRLMLDLIGLPPTPAEVDDFIKDESPNAYAKLVDRLMESPHYGEKQALPWLDAGRYADSNGFQQDGDTFQWVWRDWVVNALNDNVPFDRFTIEQLAGDLLPNPTESQKIATAFNRNHLVNGEGGAIPEEQRFNNLFDRVDTTATNWLALTMACAQCHDHKYDPMTMKDYYSLLAAFNNVSDSGVAGRQTSKTRVSPPFIETPTLDQKANAASLDKIAADLSSALTERRKLWELKVASDDQFKEKDIRDLVLAKTSKKDRKEDAEKLTKYFEEKAEPELAKLAKAADKEAKEYRGDDWPRVMVMVDDRPRETNILDRGEYLKKKDKVEFSTPAFLPPLPEDAPRNRLGLARWLVSPEHPLTARVAVNRAWQNFFGVGLVKTSEDFGVQGDYPIHQDLLDWLAVEFRESGWDVKRLHRLIVTSQTYKQSSRLSADLLAKDPENKYLARFPRVRLPAMVLRDIALATSGLIDLRVGGKPVYPYQPAGIWDGLAITMERDFTYPNSSGRDLYRRSLYTFWRRTVGPANMFDASSRQTCRVKPSSTNTPLHALTTLNDPTWAEAARTLASKLMRMDGKTEDRLTHVFRLVLARKPNARELETLAKILHGQKERFARDPKAADKFRSIGVSPRDEKFPADEHAAWAAVCLALFNLDEALTRE
jgi:hypothetical protein